MEFTTSVNAVGFVNCNEQLIGDGMTFSGFENRHLGAIQTISLPPNWKVSSTSFAHGGEWMLTTFAPQNDPRVELRIFCRGDKVTVSDANYFATLLRELTGQVLVLKPEHIMSLRNVLGPTIGDNQYINLNPPTSRYAARCEILQGRLLYVQGSPVMMIEGLFIESGEEMTKFLNVYINVNEADQEIQEVFYQAPIPLYSQYYRQIRMALESIKWLKPVSG
ncbi:MAG TPA: hypothetical protein V6C76_04900 [Drouetiella sp.]